MEKNNKTNNKKRQAVKSKKTAKKTKNKAVIKKRKLIVIITILICILIAVSCFVLYSSLFNIKKITVINNSRVSTEEVLQNSSLVVGQNMFRTLKLVTKNGIKTNPYVEEVKIRRKLDGEVVIKVEERTPTYMLQRQEDYVYINNQGYILEIAQEPLQVQIIKGYATEDFTLGKRVVVEDLEKLDKVMKIMETARNNGIRDIITAIDISDENNFILEIPSEDKTVHFGDTTNITIKVLWIVDLIDREKGIKGEIVLNVPNIKKVYFRESV